MKSVANSSVNMPTEAIARRLPRNPGRIVKCSSVAAASDPAIAAPAYATTSVTIAPARPAFLSGPPESRGITNQRTAQTASAFA